MKLSTANGTPQIGETISQVVTAGTAKGFVAAYDVDTKVIKFVQDR